MSLTHNACWQPFSMGLFLFIFSWWYLYSYFSAGMLVVLPCQKKEGSLPNTDSEDSLVYQRIASKTINNFNFEGSQGPEGKMGYANIKYHIPPCRPLKQTIQIVIESSLPGSSCQPDMVNFHFFFHITTNIALTLHAHYAYYAHTHRFMHTPIQTQNLKCSTHILLLCAHSLISSHHYECCMWLISTHTVPVQTHLLKYSILIFVGLLPSNQSCFFFFL